MSRPRRSFAAASFAVLAASLLAGCGLQFPFRAGNAPAYPLPTLDPTGSKSLAQPLPKYGTGSVAYGAGAGSDAGALAVVPPGGAGLDPGPSALPMEPPTVTEPPLAVKPSARTNANRPAKAAAKPVAKVAAKASVKPSGKPSAKPPAETATPAKPATKKIEAVKAPAKKTAVKATPAKAPAKPAKPTAKPAKPALKKKPA